MSSPSENPRSLAPSDLAWRCPSDWFGFRTTGEITVFEEAARQREAVLALRLGLRIRARGYNVYLAGMPGTGRTGTVRQILEEERGDGPPPDDLLYVQNLDDPRAPRFLRLPAGKGRLIRDAMSAAKERYRQALAALRASGAHRQRREKVAHVLRERQSRLVSEFQEQVNAAGFALIEVNLGAIKRHDIAPLIEGQPVAVHELPGLVREERLKSDEEERLRRVHSELSARLADTTATMRSLSSELEEALAEADRGAARPLVDEAIAEIREAVGLAEGAQPDLDRYLQDIREFLLGAFPLLFTAGEGVPVDGGDDAIGDPLEALRVNVIVDRTGARGRPVVEESFPTPGRLLGTVDVQRASDGSVRADISGIRAGALLQADGGFLLVNAHDLVSEEGGWPALRRVLRTGKVALLVGRDGEGPAPLVPSEAPVDVTVILVGSPGLRDALSQGDEEFGKLFKVTALLEDRIPLTREAASSYAAYLARVVAEENLLPFEAGAAGRLVEFMVRLAGSRTKLSTRFRLFTDLAREASWHARETAAGSVAAQHVDQALALRRERQGALSGRIRESLRDGTLMLQLDGARVGQVNALAVVETSLERFGYPVRITATAAVGRSGIIDIEREAELSGEIHTKASLILAGYLRSRFAQRHPLAVTASLCFEQSYGGVEGDSASSAELVALLSALAEVPVRQDVAITGAVDQQGNILAVGGVNEKVEGFWRACCDRGLTGTQGVVVPASTVVSLQLEPALVDDVAAGKFSIFAVDSVDALVRLATGLPLGSPAPDGEWPAATLGERIARRLATMASVLRAYGSGSLPEIGS